jgi:hypothetical protein
MLKLKNNLGILMIFFMLFIYFIYVNFVLLAIFNFHHLIMDHIMLNIFVIALVFIMNLNHHHYDILDYS